MNNNKKVLMEGPVTRKRKTCPFIASGVKAIDFKDVETLKQFITEKGKILHRRATGVSARFQRKLAKAIKRARMVSLLPFHAREG